MVFNRPIFIDPTNDQLFDLNHVGVQLTQGIDQNIDGNSIRRTEINPATSPVVLVFELPHVVHQGWHRRLRPIVVVGHPTEIGARVMHLQVFCVEAAQTTDHIPAVEDTIDVIPFSLTGGFEKRIHNQQLKDRLHENECPWAIATPSSSFKLNACSTLRNHLCTCDCGCPIPRRRRFSNAEGTAAADCWRQWIRKDIAAGNHQRLASATSGSIRWKGSAMKRRQLRWLCGIVPVSRAPFPRAERGSGTTAGASAARS